MGRMILSGQSHSILYLDVRFRLLVGIERFENETGTAVNRTECGTNPAGEIGAEKYLKCDLMTMGEVKVMFTVISGLVEVIF